jgi:Mrp family chromosome partitioning ATPase
MSPRLRLPGTKARSYPNYAEADGKVRKPGRDAVGSLPLDLPSQDGGLLLTLPMEVITPIRRMVTLLSSTGELAPCLSVVASLREEGVTYTTMALGLTAASDLHSMVCVVELNWWWPGLARMLSLAPGPGAAGALLGTSSLEQALVPTGLPNLTLLPAGDVPEAQRPALARCLDVRDLIAHLKSSFDLVLLDVPAVQATSDAIPLASLSSSSLLVVRQGVTSVESAREALTDLGHLTVHGVILSRAHLATPRRLRQLIPQEA